jgi:predicted DNA-binding protein
MKRTMIYLPDETHQGLRKLAFEANTSVANLIRKAVEAVYGEDIEDIQVMEGEIAHFKAHPESATSLADYVSQKKSHVPG